MHDILAPNAARALPQGHPTLPPRRIGILIVNLGTPDATTYWAVRRYLREFLSDPRVIEIPRAVWWPILHGFILTTRPGRKGRDYAAIWNNERDESPLKTITRAQADALTRRIGGTALGDVPVLVDWAMRYGNPALPTRLAALQAQGCDRILLVPLYPQYSAATTATVCDKAFAALAQMRWQPSIRVAPPWYDDPAYIDALAASIRESVAALPFEPEVILASFHGLPKATLLKGDPYHCHCAKTARLLGAKLGLPPERFLFTFQSRFGRAEWLQPYTDHTVKRLAREGVKRIAVVTPGFVADCIETLEEISIENAGYFREGGGEQFAAIPCLNASAPGIDVLEAVIRRELRGWAER